VLCACALPLPESCGQTIDLGIDMNLIAGNGHRKWAYRARLVTAAAALVLLGMQAPPAAAGRPFSELFGPPRQRGSAHVANIPLPKSRPAEAPAAGGDNQPAEQPSEKDKSTEQAPAAPQPSACRAALTEEIAIAPSIPDVHGPGGCGGTDLVRLEAIMLPDKHRVAVTPAATLRCAMASAIADWVRTDIAPLTEKLGSEITALDNFDSYECRGFNRIPGAHLSEHGRANALDVRAFKLADGRSISLTDRTVSRETRESVLHSVCARFMTVLGPDSDGYHEDHIHLDLAERRNNYRICEWDVLDPLPKVAPLMPAERPDDAPPREVAAKSDNAKSDNAKSDNAKSDNAKSDNAKPEVAEPSTAEEAKPAVEPKRAASTKKRR
jgi:hypothetical protein